MPLLVNNNDLKRARKATELALSRFRVVDSDAPPSSRRDELQSFNDIEEFTGSVARVTREAVEGAITASGKASHGEVQTPFGFTLKGPVAMLPWILLAGLVAWMLYKK